MTSNDDTHPDALKAAGNGKVILFGEHAVVYGSHAIAAPIPLAVEARVITGGTGVRLAVPRWEFECDVAAERDQRSAFERPAARILELLDLLRTPMRIEVIPNLPRAMGLGGSAAAAVAIVRALDRRLGLNLSNQQVNELAFEAEREAHGNPSGIDNSVATFGDMVLFRRGDPPLMRALKSGNPLRFVIGVTGVESLTARMVGGVRRRWERSRRLYNRLFDQIDQVTVRAIDAIRASRLETLGEMMNQCQDLLSELQVSSPEIDELVKVARDKGALGAKLTGAGGGGSVIALCPDNAETVAQAFRDAGFEAMEIAVK